MDLYSSERPRQDSQHLHGLNRKCTGRKVGLLPPHGQPYNRVINDRVKTDHYAQDRDHKIDTEGFLDYRRGCPVQPKRPVPLLTPGVERHLPSLGDVPVKLHDQDCIRAPGHWNVSRWAKSNTHDNTKEMTRRSMYQKEKLLPLLPTEERCFPYRYSSAGPSKCNGTRKEQQLHTALRTVTKHAMKGFESNGTFIEHLDHCTEHPYYETTSLQSSLEPFRLFAKKMKTHSPIQPGRTGPLMAKYVAHSNFGQHVTDNLHPNWTSDSRYFRHPKYHFLRHKEIAETNKPDWCNKF